MHCERLGHARVRQTATLPRGKECAVPGGGRVPPFKGRRNETRIRINVPPNCKNRNTAVGYAHNLG